MQKISTDPALIRLGGPTMGSSWSALIPAAACPTEDRQTRLTAEFQAAVDLVDTQMSTWRPDSDLMRLNAAPAGDLVPLPEEILAVLAAALKIGAASDGAFDIGMGEAVSAWGFGPEPPSEPRIRAALKAHHVPAHKSLVLSPGQARKTKEIKLDLSGIAKGYGVDRMTGTAQAAGLESGLFSIDGEVRALGCQPDGSPWHVLIERPDDHSHRPLSLLSLADAAVATSGDYRHWVEVAGLRLSHTMDPKRGGPLARAPASVSVVAPDCMQADAWATVMMVLGPKEGAALARAHQLHVLFVLREGADLRQIGIGPLFETPLANSA
jgi:FAD:protein FMN transferase